MTESETGWKSSSCILAHPPCALSRRIFHHGTPLRLFYHHLFTRRPPSSGTTLIFVIFVNDNYLACSHCSFFRSNTPLRRSTTRALAWGYWLPMASSWRVSAFRPVVCSRPRKHPKKPIPWLRMRPVTSLGSPPMPTF